MLDIHTCAPRHHALASGLFYWCWDWERGRKDFAGKWGWADCPPRNKGKVTLFEQNLR